MFFVFHTDLDIRYVNWYKFVGCLGGVGWDGGGSPILGVGGGGNIWWDWAS